MVVELRQLHLQEPPRAVQPLLLRPPFFAVALPPPLLLPFAVSLQSGVRELRKEFMHRVAMMEGTGMCGTRSSACSCGNNSS